MLIYGIGIFQLSREKVSVLIPTLNGGRLFHRCLHSVSLQKLDRPFEIIVIDSGSCDGSDRVAESYARVIRIPAPSFNHGLTRNLGISESNGELVAMLVQDAVPCDRFWLQNLVHAFDDPETAGAYSRQIPHPGANPIVAARLKRWSAGGTKRVIKRMDAAMDFEAKTPEQKVEIVSFDNVSSMLRKSVWKKMPFPEADFGEDIRWSLAALRAGWKIVYEPQSAVWHSHSNSLWYEFKRVYMDHQNWNRLVGLKVFTIKFEILRAGFKGIFERWREIDEVGMPALSKIYWKAWAAPYSFSQNLAQFLGAISTKWMDTGPWLEKVDAFLKKGV